ncbi:MAG: GNAT family N-acetyltransferase [Nocardioides sp.]
MSRSAVSVRNVRVEDAPELQALWAQFSRRPARGVEAVEEVAQAIRLALAADDTRIVVAEVAGEFAGAVHLSIRPIGPMTPERAVHASHLRVVPELRRRGVGRVLVESAVAWAEENAVAHVAATSVMNSRNGNRFLARLGLAPAAVMRIATTAQMRARLPVERTASVRPTIARTGTGNRHIGQVLAARRSARRQQNPV